jgi:esterase/lipase
MSQFWNFLTSLPVGRELSLRHRPSAVGEDFQCRAESLEAYVAAGRHKVETGRTDLDNDRRDWIVDGNSPFVLRPAQGQDSRRGILMVHGLTDSPYQLRDMAQFFHRRGCHVLAMQLPGHGTRPGDLLEIDWRDWLGAHQHLLELLSAEVEQVFLLGFSAGATLSLYQALRHDHVNALFLFSPAVRIPHLTRLARGMSQLGRRWPRFAWLDVQPDSDFFKYESLTTRAVSEVFGMIQGLNRLGSLSALRTPVFVAASDNDVTVNTRVLPAWFGRLAGRPRRMLYYSTRRLQAPADVRIINAAQPAQGIRSFAHTAMLHPPSDPHYGVDGAYRFCNHYYHLDPPRYRRCKEGREDCLGEMFQETADCRVVRRLTFNPLFDDMLDELDGFLQRLPRPSL